MNENNYIYKPLAIIQDKRLTPLEQDYLCLIAQLEKVNGCTASNNYFAKYFGVTRARVVGVITSLRKKGFIESSEIKQNGETIQRTIRIIDAGSKKSLLRGSKDSPMGVVRKTSLGNKESTHHTIDNTLDKTIDKKASHLSRKIDWEAINQYNKRIEEGKL